MKSLQTTGAILTALSLSGCSAVAYKAKLPDVSNHCTEDLKQIERTPLRYASPDAKLRYVEFADIAKCYRTSDESTTPLVIYQLDGVTAPAQITVSASLSTGGTFAGAADVLDADYRSIRRYGFDRFVRRGSEYSLDIFLNEADPPAAFLLLSPDRTQVGKTDVAIGSISSAMVVPAGPVMFTVNNGNEVKSVRPFMEGGKLLVTAKPQGSAAFSNGSQKK